MKYTAGRLYDGSEGRAVHTTSSIPLIGSGFLSLFEKPVPVLVYKDAVYFYTGRMEHRGLHRYERAPTLQVWD